jgi:hypothetical protein
MWEKIVIVIDYMNDDYYETSEFKKETNSILVSYVVCLFICMGMFSFKYL